MNKKVLNQHLRNMRDGSGRDGKPVLWFKTRVRYSSASDYETAEEFGEIWWPFAIHFDVETDLNKVTHLPSGYLMPGKYSAPLARRFVRAIRALKLDWDFDAPEGAKWDVVKVKAKPTLVKFLKLSKRKAA